MYLNAHTCNLAFENEQMLEALCKADMVYCDGEGVRFGAHVLGLRVPERTTAADFLPGLACGCARRGTSIYLLGGDAGVAEAAASRLREFAPGLCVAGTHHGYFLSPRDSSNEVIERINRARPGILFVGLGSPLQEIWTCRHRHGIDVPLVWCVGGVMDFVSGRSKRAPRWMRCCGLEWLFRLGHEPRRLFGRYVAGNPRFLARVFAHRFGAGRSPRLPGKAES
jgi:N-acetylglucosaminyldiphosphoundecaprenol N-acetyl-beta-D-mannosaminyltransferase